MLGFTYITFTSTRNDCVDCVSLSPEPLPSTALALVFALKLPGDLLLDEFNSMGIGPALDREAIAHDLDDGVAVLVQELRRIEGIFLCVRLQWLCPVALACWRLWRIPDIDAVRMTDHSISINVPINTV